MAPSPKSTPRELPWMRIAWFGGLLMAGFAPVLWRLAGQWYSDPDMSHGLFVPLVAGFIALQRREELLAMESKPDWRGLLVVVWGATQLFVGTLAVELFLSRTAIVISLIGIVWTLCGAAGFAPPGLPAVSVLPDGADSGGDLQQHHVSLAACWPAGWPSMPWTSSPSRCCARGTC